MDDKEIIIKIINGDINSFELIIERYEKLIFTLVFSKLKNYDESKELTQDIFIHIYEKLYLFDINKNFFSWIYKVSINKINEYFRKHKNLRKEIDISEFEHIKFPENNYDLNNEDKIDLLNALDKLNEKEKNILIMKYFLNYSIQEISQLININISNVKIIIMRAKEKLITFLKEDNYEK